MQNTVRDMIIPLLAHSHLCAPLHPYTSPCTLLPPSAIVDCESAQDLHEFQPPGDKTRQHLPGALKTGLAQRTGLCAPLISCSHTDTCLHLLALVRTPSLSPSSLIADCESTAPESEMEQRQYPGAHKTGLAQRTGLCTIL